MKKSVLFALGSICWLGTAAAQSGPELAKQKNCFSCHLIDKRLVGPSFKEVADKYRGNAGAPAALGKKIREGGTGVWGELTMPANPQVSEAQAADLVKWILAQ